MAKNLRQSIRRSLGRYIAIVLIIALGAAIFVGLRTTKSDMVLTGAAYMDSQNMFDLRLISSYGWSKDQVEQIAQLEGIHDAEGSISLDVLAIPSYTQTEGVYKLHSIPTSVNLPLLLGGRMPESPNECLADGSRIGDAQLGSTYTVSARNETDTLESLKEHTFTVVGYVNSPLYMDMSRGNTTIGNGSVASFLYIPEDAFDVDYYAEVYVTLDGDYEVYTDAYNDAMTHVAESLEPMLLPFAEIRFENVRMDAEEAYQDGLSEFHDGLEEYHDGKLQTEQTMDEALEQLREAEAQLEANRQLITDGEKQIAEGQALLDENALTLAQSMQMLAQSKSDAYAQVAEANTQLMEQYKLVAPQYRQVESALAQMDAGLAELDSGIAQLEAGLQQIDLSVTLLNTMINVIDIGIESVQQALLQGSLAISPEQMAQYEQQLLTLQQQRNDYAAQLLELQNNKAQYEPQLEQLKQTRDDLSLQREELVTANATLIEAMAAIEDGFMELQNSQSQIDNQFAAAEAQLEAGQAQIEAGQKALNTQIEELEKGKQAIAEGEQELFDGWEEYREGKDEADRQLSDAQIQLSQAQAELTMARKRIDEFTEPEVFALGRNTNVGYLSLDSNSDIVEGIAAVFPAFFLLIAALVCITTMTRMVEEERTQIGTLKALGYSSFAIIFKYIAYAGSAAVVGCGLGVLAGSVVFPLILWEAYSIILNITPQLLLQVDWPLCLGVVAAYTAVTLAVTWYCCRMALREVPAELIRPKPPTSGKKIFLEYLPFWDKISFLNKVMLRNIFRYRQRLLMMLIGIGGCTALLVTGFGVKDSIMDIVNIQFEEVTFYDMEVRFSDSVDPSFQEDFKKDIGRYIADIGFFYQTSVEMDFDSKTKDITLVASDKGIDKFFDFHSGSKSLELPGLGEAMLSVGVAESMGIEVGDSVLLRTSDMDTLEVTVSAIFDNHVSNFAIVTPETVAQQWGETPDSQMAYVTVRNDQDAYYAGAQIAEQDGVMTVTITDDLASQVGGMLDALNLIVITIVICAGLLAFVVLYNLTNINITERIREIATIKVLGFRAGESAAYVFKENMLLSAMGAFFGLFGGKALLTFVMSQIKVDMVWFQARVQPLSFVWSILLTMLCACIVDFVLYFKLEKINMAEALKSVE